MKLGFNNLHYSIYSDGKFQPPERLSGAVHLNVGEGNNPVFYRDVCVGFSKNPPSAGELEIAELTDNFAENILGYKQNENGIFSISPMEYPHHFALMFEENSISGMQYRYIMYNCICVPKNFDFNTVKDKKTIRTYKFDIFAGKYKGKYIDFVSSDQPIFDSFFNEVVNLW